MNKGSSHVFILIAIIGIIFVGVYFFVSQNNPYKPLPTPTNLPSFAPTPTPALKTFKSSSAMDFTVDIPTKYEVEERSSSVSFIDPNGEIRVLRNGTEFANLEGYIQFLEDINKVSFEKETDLEVNNLAAQKGKLNGEVTYFIYVDHMVYSLSTEKPELYDDLDQIAKSFRYTPD